MIVNMLCHLHFDGTAQKGHTNILYLHIIGFIYKILFHFLFQHFQIFQQPVEHAGHIFRLRECNAFVGRFRIAARNDHRLIIVAHFLIDHPALRQGKRKRVDLKIISAVFMIKRFLFFSCKIRRPANLHLIKRFQFRQQSLRPIRSIFFIYDN